MFDDHDGSDGFSDHHGGFEALEAGAAYALFRHGQDRQTDQLIDAINRRSEYDPDELEVVLTMPEERAPAPVNALDFATAEMPDSWDDYIGQEPLKRTLAVKMAAAQQRGARFPHALLASGFPGIGKTTMARLLAKTMDVDIYELVPPFRVETFVEAAHTLRDHDVLFVDEIHKLADSGKRGAEFLLKMLEDNVVFMPNGDVEEFADITVIGATTERDKLPETVVDRFKVKPYFAAYSWAELSQITITFAAKHHALNVIDDDLAVDIAGACRGTPRIIEEMVESARDLAIVGHRPPTTTELLEYLEVEPDGLTRTHVHYLTAMRQYFARESADGFLEYIVGEAAIQQILRETKPGLQRVEAFLVERGLVDRTPRGRRLTDAGIARAEQFIATGKGAADVA